MSFELPTLWQPDCESSCHAYGECGGSPSAPCGCAFLGTDQAYICDECRLNCRERAGTDFGDTGEAHYNDGLALDDLRIANGLLDLPVLIPAVTRELARHALVPAAAAGFADLFRRDPGVRLTLARRAGRPRELKSDLRCAQDGMVVGILNGTDRLLEMLWNADMSVVGPQLAGAGMTAITGPTFSVLGEKKTVTPYHNLTMLRRHHRIAQTLFDQGLQVIPNLYWRSDEGLRRWADVLRRSDIRTVSRDFSRTRNGPQFEAQIRGLLDLLVMVGRPMRVLVIGVGIRKATRVFRHVQAAGCKCTIVTSDPVRLAINRGAAVFRRRSGEIAIRPRPDRSREELALRNIIVLRRELLRLEGPAGRLKPLGPVRHLVLARQTSRQQNAGSEEFSKA